MLLPSGSEELIREDHGLLAPLSTLDKLLLDLYNALRPLDAITRETTAEDVRNNIFSTFCIGK